MKKLITLLICANCANFVMAQDISLKWVSQYEGADLDEGTGHCVDSQGNIISVGFFSGTVDFDPGPGMFNLTSTGGFDAYILKLDPSGQLLWAVNFGGTLEDRIDDVAIDLNDNIFVTGRFQGTCDFDPGTGVSNLVCNGPKASFFCKYDPNGNYEWAGTIESPGYNEGTLILTDSNDDVYISGAYRETADFDPGVGVSTMTCASASYKNQYILKLDNLGNFIWAKPIDGSATVEPYQFEIDIQNNLYFAGIFYGNTDFDPGAGVSQFTPTGSDGYFLKLDSAGDYQWVQVMEAIPRGIGIDGMKNIFLSGNFSGTVDFDTGPGVQQLTSVGGQDAFLYKMDSIGNYIWAVQFGSVDTDYSWDMDIDQIGNSYVSGTFQNAIDFDPGPGNYILSPEFFTEASFIVKIDSDGNLVRADKVGGAINGSYLYIDEISISNPFLITCSGYFQKDIDFDPDSTSYILNSISNSKDGFTFVWEQDSCSQLTLIIDSVDNISCQNNQGFGSGYAINGFMPYDYVWDTPIPTLDSVVIFNQVGIYTLTVVDSLGCTRSSSIINDVAPYISDFDLNANLLATNFRANETSHIWIDAFNDGCISTDGYVYLVLDTLTSLISASPNPNTINGDTLFWNFATMNYDSLHFKPNVLVSSHPDALLGDTVCLDLGIKPFLGDIDSSNNIKTYCFGIVGSYDPNDKQVYPQGVCDPKYVLNEETYTYTVRFQNTGTAEAIDIFIIDTLSDFLDSSTVRVVGQSHYPLITEILDSSIIKFRFDNIWLPDSMSNEPESHGYVIFEIDIKPGISEGTLIENSVGIYFDNNPPVITNSVSNTYITAIPNPDSLNCFPINNVGLEQNGKTVPGLNIYPNPNHGLFTIVLEGPFFFEISDLHGKAIVKGNSVNFVEVDITDFQKGLYILKAYNSQKEYTSRIVHY